jgi:transposase
MYLRKTKRTYKGKSYTNHLLVESVYTPAGPRQKAVCSLGDLKPRSRAQWLELVYEVEEALVGQGDLFADGVADPEVASVVSRVRRRRTARKTSPGAAGEVIGVVVERVETERHREAGPEHVGLIFWERLGLGAILKELGLSERVRGLLCAMVLNRLIAPKAEYAMPDWIRSTALDDLLGMDFSELAEDALYRAMDEVHPHRTAIESALAAREESLFNLDRTVYLYDLTSTYFEGLAKRNRKAKRGYSRDKRPDCKQVVVALVVNRDGFPLVHEVLEGNTQDRATVPRLLDLLDARVGLCEGQTVVVDRGMAYPENLAEFKRPERKLHYVVATRQNERDQFLADFEDPSGFEEVIRMPSPTNPFQKKSQIRVKRKTFGDETYVLCVSSERSEKDRAIRELHEKRLLEDAAALQTRIEKGRLKQAVKIGEAIGRIKERYPRVARYYTLEYNPETNQFTCAVDEAKRGHAEELDGSYLLRTDRRDLSAEDFWRLYMLLTRAENAFRDMKTPLALRPIYHHVTDRADTHIFLCIVAYHVLVAIEKTLLDQGVHTSWETVRYALKTHQVCTVVLPTETGTVLRIRKASTPEPEHQRLYELLRITRPIINPRKTWTKARDEA